MEGIRRIFGDLLGDATFGNRDTDFPSRPFFVYALTGDANIIREDVMQRVRASRTANQERFLLMRFNEAIYAGLQYFPKDVQVLSKVGLQPQLVAGNARVTSNHVQRLVDTQVTEVLNAPHDITVIPTGDKFEDGVLAEMIQELLESLDAEHQRSTTLEMLQRRARLSGEAYRWFHWDEDAGGEHPSSKRLREASPIIEIEDVDGTMRKIERPIMQGDVAQSFPFTWDVGLDPKPTPMEVDWCFKIKARPIDELKFDYQDADGEIIAADNAWEWSDYYMQPMFLRDHALEVTFYARSKKYLPDGYKVICTPSIMLEHGPSDVPKTHSSMWGNLPIERVTDADLDSILHGWSRMRNITHMQNQHDNALTQIAQNIFIGSRPKWIFPLNSVNVKRLANKETMVGYKGPTAPQLVTFPTVPNEVFLYRDIQISDMEKNYKVHPISSGDVPKGVTAAQALQFLDQEQERAATIQRIKNEEFIISSHEKSLAFVRELYDKTDERFSTIIQGSSWKVKYFDAEALNCDCKVVMRVGTDLPKRKDALMQTVIQMSQIWPNMYPEEAVADMFRIGHAKRFMNEARAAWQSAEDENYMASKGQELPDPEPWENVLVHWRGHAKGLQLPEFKHWPTKRQQILIRHQRATEYLMLIRLKQNPVLASQIQQLPSWPMTLPLPDDFGTPQSAVEGGGIAPGQLQVPEERGEPGSAPAQPASNAGANQIRFPNGQFGNKVQEVR